MPELRLAIWETRNDIDRQSSLKELDSDNALPYTRFITTPHRIIYEDTRLKLTLPECGTKISMPTVLSFDNNYLIICTASVLGEYVDVYTAAKKARSLLAEVSSQGFTFLENKTAHLHRLDYFSAPGTSVPERLSQDEDIEPYFLNPKYGVGSIIVFQLHSGGLMVDLRMKNMRRSFHDGTEQSFRAQEDGISDEQRRSEKSYYLEISFSNVNPVHHGSGPPPDWKKN